MARLKLRCEAPKFWKDSVHKQLLGVYRTNAIQTSGTLRDGWVRIYQFVQLDTGGAMWVGAPEADRHKAMPMCIPQKFNSVSTP